MIRGGTEHRARTLRRAHAAALLVPTLAAALVACGSSTAPGETNTPVGVVVSMGDSTVVVAHGTDAEGSFRVQAGDSTPAFSVTFVDGDGKPVPVSGSYMGGEVLGSVVASFEATSPGAFTGVIIGGEAEGSTRARFSLYHGAAGSGEKTYTSPWITVTVLGGG